MEIRFGLVFIQRGEKGKGDAFLRGNKGPIRVCKIKGDEK